MHKQKPVDYLLVVVSLVCYYFLGYEIPRYETLSLFTSLGILFLAYSLISSGSSDRSVIFWITMSFVFRAMLLFSLPQLSDDFYRFIWDGRLWVNGYHPFAALPSEYLTQNIRGVDQELYSHLNSKNYFTVYPPVSQYVFWLAVKFSPSSILGSIIVMRMIIMLTEAGSIVIILRLLKKFDLPRKRVLLYALNPLVIMELTGNLHFEAIVIFFILLTVIFLTQKKLLLSASSIGVAICVKLIPLIFLPAFIGRMTFRKLFLFFLTVTVAGFLIFFPFLDWEVINSMNSVGLYFNKFEFNASLYYLVREFGYIMYGYNIIQTVGWKLAILVFVLIMTFIGIRIRQAQYKSLVRSDQTIFIEWMWIFSIYLLFTTTLHPWYISTLLALSIFTPYRFVVVWSGLIFLTYAGYSQDSFEEQLWLTALEYSIVLGYLGYELWIRRRTFYLPWKQDNLME